MPASMAASASSDASACGMFAANAFGISCGPRAPVSGL